MLFKIKNGYVLALMVVGLCFAWELQADNDGSGVSNTPSLSFVFTSQVENVPEKLLSKIAEYWGYKGNFQFSKAYLLEAPHTRYQLSLEKYLKMHKKARKLNGVLLLNVDEFYDMVEIRLKATLDRGSEQGTNNDSQIMTERWVKIENSWYHVFGNSLLNMF